MGSMDEGERPDRLFGFADISGYVGRLTPHKVRAEKGTPNGVPFFMPLWSDPQSNPKRRPALKGALMLDVTQGVERVRAWPKPRGSDQPPKFLEMQEFMRHQSWAFKWLDARIQTQIMEARVGTPLMPRDLGMMMFANTLTWVTTPSGQKWFPRKVRNEVSLSLDSISQTKGDTLVRGEQFWEGVPYQGGPEAIPWQLIASGSITTPTSSVQFDDIDHYTEVIFLARLLTMSTSGFRFFRVSTDGGTSFLASTADYRALTANGVENSASDVGGHGVSASAARTVMLHMQNNSGNMTPIFTGLFDTRILNSQSGPVTNVRLMCSAGTMTSGQYLVIGRGIPTGP